MKIITFQAADIQDAIQQAQPYLNKGYTLVSYSAKKKPLFGGLIKATAMTHTVTMKKERHPAVLPPPRN